MVAALAWRGPALAADEGPYPIWWSPVLELDSLDHVEQRLDRRLWRGVDVGLELGREPNWSEVRALADNCRSLMTLTADGYDAGYGEDYDIQFELLAECRAIAMLGRATPARQSHVRQFAMDSGALDQMPAPPIGPSCELICRQIHASESGVPWRGFQEIERVDRRDETTIEVLTGRTLSRVRLLGRADFSGDGIEDLLTIAGSWTKARNLDVISLRSTSLVVLTRRSPDAVLRILDPQSYRCPVIECAAAYELPVPRKLLK
jgi:hypothetical protein